MAKIDEELEMITIENVFNNGNIITSSHGHTGTDAQKVKLEDLHIMGKWEDLIVPSLVTKTNASAPDLITFGASGGLLTYGFDGGVTAEQVYFVCQLPHSYKEGTDIFPHIHWSPVNTDIGNIKWQLEYSLSNHTAGTFPTSTTISVITATLGTAWKHQKTSFPQINGSTIKISEVIVGRLFRDPTDSDDTYGSDAAFLSIDFHFQQNSIGSRQEKIK